MSSRKRIIDYLVVEYVRRSHAWVFQVRLPLAYLIREYVSEPATFTSEHTRRIVHYNRIKYIFTEPVRLLENVYGWEYHQRRPRDIDERLFDLASLDIPASLEFPYTRRG